MNPQNDNSKITRRERDLYSRNAPDHVELERGQFTQQEREVPGQWQSGAFEEALKREYKEAGKGSFFKKFFIGSIVFFAIAVITFVYMSFGGFNAVSSKNVDITVQGPVAINGGEELVLDIIVTNNNKVPLEGAELLIEYPVGTRKSTDLSAELLRHKEDVGTIAPGESVTKTVKSVLFGEKDEVKEIKVSVDYKAKGSNATFTKEKKYEIAIKSSPVFFTVEYPHEVNSNQSMEMTLTVTSNSNTPVENLLVKVEYPFGFSYTDALPKPTFDTNIWSIGTLNPKEKKVIKISGRIEGQNDEEKTFRFNAGTAKVNDEKIIGVDLVATQETVTIRKPFFDVRLALEDNTDKEYIAKAGERVDGILTWTNNLPVSINDVELEVKLDGQALNRDEVTGGQFGFYNSINNNIFWDKRRLPSLSEIDPGERGETSFSFETKSIETGGVAMRSPEMTLEVTIKGTRFSETQPPEIISYTFSRKVKVMTEIGLNTRAVYSEGPFNNTGPIPPRAEQKTTYTIIWTISNAFNDIGNTSISASLPPYVKWIDSKSPSGERILYNPNSNKVVWEPGDIKAGVGTSQSPREVAFQLEFLPSLGQVGETPVLIDKTTFTATDRFTNKELVVTKNALTTRITTDPEYSPGDDKVVK